MTIRVTNRGDVSDVRLFKTSGYGALDRSTLAAARTWRFSPAIKDHKAVEGDITLKVVFDLKQELSEQQYAECLRRWGQASPGQ